MPNPTGKGVIVSSTSWDEVAKVVSERWNHVVAGDYTPPPCPEKSVLRDLLQAVNYASGFPEEGRYPRFNVTATNGSPQNPGVWRLSQPRPLTVSELRRLIPATDVCKSAVHVEWHPDDSLSITGIHDIGTSWHPARMGLSYQYDVPHTLLVEVERPNRLHIYQGQHRIATFSDGKLHVPIGLDLPLFLHDHANIGLSDLSERLIQPADEPPHEYENFEFIALWNCYAGIVNSISKAGHGGALILVPSAKNAESSSLRMKYSMRCSSLTDAFVDFINARHEVANLYWLLDHGDSASSDPIARLDWKARTAFDRLVERIRLVAGLARCDGAVVVTRALELLGFGCEIVAQLRPGAAAYEVTHEIPKQRTKLAVEQFGMRHRSAVKFVSQCIDAVALVVSQDGPISGVWADEDSVYVRRGVRLVNANLPWT